MEGGRLRRRLLALFLLFSLIPLFVTNGVGYSRSVSILRGMVHRDLAALADVHAQRVAERIERQELLLEAIISGNIFLASGAMVAQGMDAGEIGRRVATRDAMEEYLRTKQEELPAFAALYLTTPDGNVVAAAGDPAEVLPLPVSVEPTLVAAHGDPEGPQRLRLTVPVPAPAPGGATVGYLCATVTLEALAELLEIPPRLAEQIATFVVDSSGRPVFISSPHDSLSHREPLGTPLLLRQPGSLEVYPDREGREVMGTVEAIEGLPWRFVAEIATADAFGGLHRLRTFSLLLQTLFLGVLIGAAWLAARTIVDPVQRLVSATRQVARGDLAARVPVAGRDEIGELGRAFNEMASTLEATTGHVEELHQREIARTAQLATVGELASGVAHEIKNPVVSVASGLDLLRRRIPPAEETTRVLDEMARQLDRVQRALGDLLTFARLSTPRFAAVTVPELLEQSVAAVRPAAEHAGVHLRITPVTAPPPLMADEDMLHRALVNLLMNAIDATPRGGQVTVTPQVTAAALRLVVSDTGRGIPDADLANVFKPFFTTRHAGTGLGLPIARDIMAHHGGAIDLTSREGQGTTVTLTIPHREDGGTG